MLGIEGIYRGMGTFEQITLNISTGTTRRAMDYKVFVYNIFTAWDNIPISQFLGGFKLSTTVRYWVCIQIFVHIDDRTFRKFGVPIWRFEYY